jgi:hypothetical protein
LVLALELAAKGYFPTLYLIPAALSSSSFLPTHLGVGVDDRGDGVVVDVSVAVLDDLDGGDA